MADYDGVVGQWQPQRVQPRPQNKYDGVIDTWDQDEATQIRANSIGAADVNPDQFAQHRIVAQRVGLPVAAVAPAPNVPRRQAIAQQIDQHTQGAPVARKAYTDHEFAQVGHDDSHNVGLLDRLMQFAAEPLMRRVAAYVPTSPLGLLSRTTDAIGSLFGYKPGDIPLSAAHAVVQGTSGIVGGVGDLSDARAHMINRIAGDNPTAKAILNTVTLQAILPTSNTVRPIYSKLDAAAADLEARVQTHGRLTQAADLVGGIVPYLLVGEAAPFAMALSGAHSQAQAAEAAGKQGTSASDLGVFANAGLQGLLGKFVGGDAFAELVPGFGGALTEGASSALGRLIPGSEGTLTSKILSQAIGEGGETTARLLARGAGAGLTGVAMQGGANLIEKMSVNPDKDLTEGVGESAASMALLDLGFHALRSAGHSATGRYVAAAKGHAEGNILDGLNLIAEASKIRERAPDVWQSYLQAVTDEHGAPDAVYVSPEAFAKTFSTPEGQVALQRMPEGVRDAVEVSAKTGGDVRIPTHEFGTFVAGTKLYEQLAEHIKFDPNSYTRAEAADVLKTEGPRVLAELDRAVRGKAATDEFHASRDRVEAKIKEQLDQAGRFSPEVNAINAKLGAHSIATMAARTGMTPEEFHAKHGFAVGNGEARTASQAFEQNDRALIGNATSQRRAFTFDQARAHAAEFVGKALHNDDSGANATVSNNNLSKMLSASAARKSTSPAEHAQAVANIDALFRHAILDHSHADAKGEPTIAAIHRYIAPMITPNGVRAVKMTVKETVHPDQPNPLYSIETLEVEPTRNAPSTEGIERVPEKNRYTPQAGSDPRVAEMLQKVKDAHDRREPASVGEETGVRMENTLAAAKALARDNRFATGRDLKVALQERALAAQKASGVDLTKLDDETAKRLSDFVVEDALEAVQDNQNAIGWYDRAVTDAKAEMAKLFPEIATDPHAEFAFIWALAVTSNGLKVDKNFELAAKAYEAWKKTGKFPTDLGIGQAAKGINEGLALYSKLVDHFGSWEKARDFMVKEHTVRDLEKETGIPISGEGKGEMVRGAAILGPKIGNGFFSNLYGHFDGLTMDRWLMRSVGRWRGTLIESNPKMVEQKRGQIGELLSGLDPADLKHLAGFFNGSDVKLGKKMSGAQIDALANEVQKRSMAPDWREHINKAPGGEDLRKFGNALAKYLDGQVEAPAGTKERAFIRQVFRQALERLQKKEGLENLTMADLQALLWYPEKLLYESAKKKAGTEVSSYEDDEAPDYANAARKLVRNRLGQSELPASGSGLSGLAGDRSGASGSGLGDQQVSGGYEQRANPSANVIFEVAPDPNDRGLSDRWNALDNGTRLAISDKVAREVVPGVLEKLGASGTVTDQVGSYLDDTNPSFALRLESGDPLEVAKALGHVLSQDSMMVVSPDAFSGSFGTHAIEIHIGDKTPAEIDEIYQTLRNLDGVPQIGGQTTVDGVMTILLDEGMDQIAIGKAFDEALGGEYETRGHAINAAFPEKSEYGYGISDGNTGGDKGALRSGIDHARSQASEALDREVSAAERGDYQQDEYPKWGQQPVGQGAARGNFIPETSTINLLKNANLSTFIHELGHYHLETLAKFADTHPDIAKDFDTLLHWFDPNLTREQWNAMGMDERRPMHEQFARGFEAYLFEGKAPTRELRPIFQRMAAWLKNVYRSLAGLNVELTPEVRGVMDRLVATPDEIRGAERDMGYAPIFAEKPAAMTDDQWAAYQRNTLQAQIDATEELGSRSLRDLQWLEGAKSEELKKLQERNAALRQETRDEVTREIMAQPVERARELLRFGRLDGQPVEGPRRLDVDAVDRLLEGDPNAEAIKKALGYGKHGMLGRENALDPELVADQFGYASAREMIADLANQPKLKDKINEATDQRMLERYGDLTDPQAMQEAAIEAVHSDAQARVLEAELNALSRVLRENAEQTPGMMRDRETGKIVREQAEAMAQEMVGGIRVADLKAERFRAEERRAALKAEEAARTGDMQAALEAKRAQILNFHLARAVDKAREETAKALTYFKRLDKDSVRKAMGGEAAAQIDGILERYDLRSSTTNKAIAERKTLLEWVADQAAQGFEPKIDQSVLNEASRKAFRDMTLDEVRALRDAVKSIDHIGRQEQKVADGQRKIALEQAISEVLHNTADMPRVKISDRRNPNIGGKGLDRFEGKFVGLRTVVRSADAALLKIEQLFDWLDKKNPGGVFNRLVFRRLADAQGVENDMLHEFAGRMRDLAESLPRDERSQLAELITLPELIDNKTGKPSVLAKSQLISIALNSANESNFGKMLKGEGWDAEDVKAVLDKHLTAHDIAYVNGIIRTIESLWPQIEAMEQRLSGVAPEKINGRPLKLANGTIEGGYFPVVYDPMRSYGAEKQAALDASMRADQLYDAQYVKATTAKGHTEERTGYAAPILLDLNVIPNHIAQVIHDLAYREAIMDADRFLSRAEVRQAITDVMGREYYAQIRPWLKAIANDRVIDQAGQAWFDKLFHWGRTTTTMLGLGFRASTMLIHGSSAASNSIAEVGLDWMRKGTAAFVGSPAKMREAYDFVTERSAEMRHRMNETDRDIRESIREMELRSAQGSTAPVMRVLDKGREMAFYGIGALDMASALPTWLGAYMKGMERPEKGGLGMSEADAIYYADKAVRNAHGGGGIKDLARAQRGSEAEKLFTMFYSFWNHIYNRQRDLFRDAGNIKSAGDFGNVLARSWFYLVIPQILHGLLKTPSQESQDDEGTATAWLHWAAEEVALGFFSGVPVLRDFANSAITGRDYEATPVAKVANDLLTQKDDILKKIRGEEETIHNPVKHIANTVGIVTGLPLGQAGQTGQFFWDVIDGDQKPEGIADWWNGIVYGKVRQ